MAGERGGGRGSALRRYPALVWLVGAGLLALLLPSGLTLPQSGPSTLAEYAPVPGASEGSADLGQLAASQTQGVAAGGGSGERTGAGADIADDAPPPRGGRLIRKAGTKRCVGDPPRQTEDPLSPPCIAFFDGDNGGATEKGVSREVVTVSAFMENLSRDPDAGNVFDCTEGVKPDDSFRTMLCKAYTKYFNDRYQTYGRTVRVLSHHNVGVKAMDERYNLFAEVQFTSASAGPPKYGVLSVGYVGDQRATYQKNAPMLQTFKPDYEDSMAMASSYVCTKLAGRNARYAGDLTYRTQKRKFALWTTDNSLANIDRALLKGLAECGVTIDDENMAFSGSDRTAAARFKVNGVTTVILNIQSADAVAGYTKQATAAGFYPEYFVAGSRQSRGVDTNFYGRLGGPEQMANAFGITFDYRRGPFTEQMWYRAYKEGCPACPEPSAAESGVSVASANYDAWSLLFYGIQAAGPRLTFANLDKGLHAIPPKASQDPFLPAAYFAPGNYSFVKDAAAIWWDPSGVAPTSSAAGCWRLVDDGLRRRAGEWPAGDDDIKRPGPCQGDTFPGG